MVLRDTKSYYKTLQKILQGTMGRTTRYYDIPWYYKTGEVISFSFLSPENSLTDVIVQLQRNLKDKFH